MCTGFHKYFNVDDFIKDFHIFCEYLRSTSVEKRVFSTINHLNQYSQLKHYEVLPFNALPKNKDGYLHYYSYQNSTDR